MTNYFLELFFVIENFGSETIFDWPHVGDKLFQKGKQINIWISCVLIVLV